MAVLNVHDTEYTSLDNTKSRKRIRKRINRRLFVVFFIIFSFSIATYLLTSDDSTGTENSFALDQSLINNVTDYKMVELELEIKKNSSVTENSYASYQPVINNATDYKNVDFELEVKKILPDFMPLYTNGTKGPITVNRKLDDGIKQNLYKIVSKKEMEDFEKFFYDYEKYESLKDVISREDEYLCQVNDLTENVEGYYLTCPKHYTITIDNSFYGRYPNDTTRCSKNVKGKQSKISSLTVEKKCGINTKFKVNELCGGRVECNLKPSYPFFNNPCKNKNKYLHVKYHCKKDAEFVKPKFAIVTFFNKISVNTIYENAVSELYQYADIHGYKFIPNSYRYDKGRDMYYMKLHVIVEAIINGLKSKEYDWVFWVDADCLIANPNIKLETFLPEDNKIHFIGARNRHGLNAGVLFFRVHEWTLDFLMRSISYAFYHKNKKLVFSDQSALSNVLTDDNEDKHYVIVPQSWFNTFPNKRKSGDFLMHFAGRAYKTRDMKTTIKELKNEPGYTTAKTNKQMRDEVLEYYNSPRSEQLSIKKI